MVRSVLAEGRVREARGMAREVRAAGSWNSGEVRAVARRGQYHQAQGSQRGTRSSRRPPPVRAQQGAPAHTRWHPQRLVRRVRRSVARAQLIVPQTRVSRLGGCGDAPGSSSGCRWERPKSMSFTTVPAVARGR